MNQISALLVLKSIHVYSFSPSVPLDSSVSFVCVLCPICYNIICSNSPLLQSYVLRVMYLRCSVLALFYVLLFLCFVLSEVGLLVDQ